MDPTKLPTDNLYKFMALCGIVLFAGAMYFIWAITNNQSQQVDQHDLLSRQLAQTLKDLEEDESRVTSEIVDDENASQQRYESFIKRWNEAADQDKDGKLTKAQRAEVLKGFKAEFVAMPLRKDFKPKLTELIDRSRKLRDKNIELKVAAENDQQLMKTNAILRWISVIVAAIGFVVATNGFRLWYDRLQRHLDRAIAEGARSTG